MGDSGRAHGAQGAGRSLLGVVIAGGGTGAMILAARSVADDARGAGAQEQLILWVLLCLAMAGALLCLYLGLVWAMAAAIQLAGPAGRTGRMLLPALRILAPRLARRVSLGAAVASAATGLVLGPALASAPVPDGAEHRPAVLQTSQLLPDEEPAPTAPEEPGDPLPSLGWGGEPSPAAERTGDETAGDEAEDDEPTGEAEDDEPTGEDESTDEPSGATDGSGTDAPSTTDDAVPGEDGAADQPDAFPAPSRPGEGSAHDRAEDSSEEATHPASEGTEGDDQPSDAEDAPAPEDEQDVEDAEMPDGPTGDGTTAAPRSVVVRPGDTLWSITDDVLGPAPDDPSLLATSWPLLHEANRDVIGEDPDLLRPGQVLTVPAGLDEGAAS